MPDPHDPVAIAILAKAPVPGFAKTRLIPALGAHGAAALQDWLIADALARAKAAATGPIHLWTTPDPTHPAFADHAGDPRITLLTQPEGDLGVRMLAAVMHTRPVLIVGTDCPALSAEALRAAADALRGDADVVVIPAEDGGYVLIGMREARPTLFTDIAWGTDGVMDATRAKLRALDMRVQEFAPLWDVDTPDDLARLGPEWQRAGFAP